MTRKRANRIGLLLMMATLVPTTPVQAAIESGVEFSEFKLVETDAAPKQLELCATGLLRYRRIFKGYAAALYQADCTASRDPLTDQPRRLELSYFWSIGGERFGRAAEKLLRESLESDEFAAIADRLSRLHASYRSVEPGDRYALTYLPESGTELSLNGRALITIEGEDFARAYFGIWLGENPMDRGLRNDLLAGSTRR